MLSMNRTVLELCLQTGGEVRNPLFTGNKMYESKEMKGLALGRHQYGLDYETLKNKLEMAVIDSVGRYNKVALLLSGGVDSSLLGRLIRDTCPDTDIVAYHTTFGIPERDELAFAESAAKHIYAELKTISCEPLAQIPIINEALRETLTPSYSVGTVYKTMMTIKSHGIDVVVNALGLDEFFAGYTSHRRFYQRRWFPKFLPFRKTSNSTYRKAAIMFGNQKAFILNLMFIDPSLNLVAKERQIDANELFKSIKENKTWNTLQRMTLNAMIDQYATLMWRCAKVAGIGILFPYINRELMDYGLNLHPSVKVNKAPIRWLMRYVYQIPEMNCSKGEGWDKIGWGGVYEPYFQCENFINAIMVENPDRLPFYFNEDTAGRYWRDAFVHGRPNRVALQMASFRKIMEMSI